MQWIYLICFIPVSYTHLDVYKRQLYDFSIRKDAKVEKGYLIGRYGAIPFIKGGL